MSQPSLAAVIVTHNRAEKLARVFDALAAQSRHPEAVYVVDNGSTDTTAELIAARHDLPLRTIRLEHNIGGAGGFHAGLKRAYQDGHDLFWISDDDAYPAPDAIALLEQALAAEPKAPFACSRVDWSDGTLCAMNVPVPVWDWPRPYRPGQPLFAVASCSFVSLLVTRAAVATAGLPIAEYFIWHDDVEYTLRLSRQAPGLFCPDSVALHDTARNRGVDFGSVTAAEAWKYRYAARNETSRRLRDQGIYGVAVFLYHIARQMKGRRVPFRLKLKVLGGVAAGLAFRPRIERV